MSCLSKSGPNKASKVRVSLAEQAVTKSRVAAESIIDAIETVACVVSCGYSSDDKNSVREGCLSARILLATAVANRQIQGLRGRRRPPTTTTLAGRVGFWCTVSFLHTAAGPSDVADRSGTLRPRRGEELDLAMEPPGPLWAPGPLQRPAEEGKRTFGPEFWPLVLQEIWKIQPRPCGDPTVSLAGGQRPSGFCEREAADVSGVKVGTMQDHAGGVY